MPTEPRTVSLAGGWIATVAPADRGWPQAMRLVLEGGGRTSPYIDQSWRPADPAARRRLERDLGGALSLSLIETLAAEVAPWAEIAHQREQQDQQATREFIRKGGTLFAPFAITARLITQPAVEGTLFQCESPDDAIALLKRGGFPAETKFEWPKANLAQLADLDLDFHDPTKPKPTDQELDQLGEDLAPAPYLWWRTQGGGLHAIYSILAHAPYTAEELAVGAAAQIAITPMVVRCGGTIEVIASTRHPLSLQKGKSCGPLRFPGPSDVFACLQRFSIAGATQAEIDDIMDDLGYALGARLDHSHCLLDPGHVSKSPNPVLVGEHGLFCYSCAGRDGNGFMSWSFVRQRHGHAATTIDNEYGPIRHAVEHFAHFGHVNYLLGSIAPELHQRYRKPLYSALLKRRHLNDMRINSVFSEFPFVRGDGAWLHADTLASVGRALRENDVSVLPSTMRVVESDDGPQLSSDQIAVSAHTNDGSIPGWTPIQPIRSVPIYSLFNIPKVIRNTIPCRPRKRTDGVVYLPPDRRVSMEIAEQAIAFTFPGISTQYMKALLAAGGCAESGSGTIPMLWATGPTGCGKTTVIKLVLDMLGEPFVELAVLKEDRMEESFGQALEKTRFVMFDDFAKLPETFMRLQAFFTRVNREGFSYHKLRHGLFTQPVNSALVLTDWKMPLSYVNQPQFARRTHLIRLPRLQQPWSKLDVEIKGWWKKTPELENAVCSFYSHLIDDFFPENYPKKFEDIMAQLGVNCLRDEAGDFTEERDILRECVYDLVIALCSTNTTVTATAKRVGRGFADVAWKQQGAIGAACTSLVESLGDVEFTSDNLNHALEPYKLELDQMFPLHRSATFQTKEIGNRTYIRLVQEGTTADRRYFVNHELMSQWPLSADHRSKTLASLSSTESTHVQRTYINGHANGHHNGHTNGHHNGHTNGNAVPAPTLGPFSQPNLPGISPMQWFSIGDGK